MQWINDLRHWLVQRGPGVVQLTNIVVACLVPLGWGSACWLLAIPPVQFALCVITAGTGACLIYEMVRRNNTGQVIVNSLRTNAVLMSGIVPGTIFIWGLLATYNWSSSHSGSSQQPPGFNSKPIDHAVVVLDVLRSVSDNGNFEKVPLSQTVPVPRPTNYTYVPPGKRLNVGWGMSDWQLTEGNHVYLAPTATALRGKEYDVNYYRVFDANIRGETIELKGRYSRPDRLAHASPNVEIGVQTDSSAIVVATASKVQPGAKELIWGKLPERSLHWKCFVHLTGAQGKPVTENRLAVQVRQANPDGTLGPKVDFAWATYAPAEDETTLEMSSSNVPAGFDYLVVPVQASTKACVALVLSK